MQFVPNQPKFERQRVPYFEDSKDKSIPGRGTEKSVSRLQSEVSQLLSDLGGQGVAFVEGKYQNGKEPRRYGYAINFSLYGNPARIDCAALPIRNESPRKKDRALAQSLYLLRDELQAVYFSQIHKPSGMPLVEYLVGPNGMTVAEALMASGTIPMLGAGNEGS